MGSVGRSFRLVKESFRVLTMDPEILAFVVLAILVIGGMYGGLFTYLYLYGGLTAFVGFMDGFEEGDYIPVVALVSLGIVSLVVWKFFEAAMMTCAYIRLKGGSPTFSDGIENSSRNAFGIVKWSIVSFMVNWVLSIIGNKTGIVGRIVTWVVKVAWELVTTFVLPVIIFEHSGIKDPIKKSADLFKRTWGENLVGQFSIGGILAILMVVGAVFVFLGVYLFQGLGTSVLVISIVVFSAYMAVVIIIGSALSSIFSTALYIYATTGKVPAAFSEDLIKGAYRTKKSSKILSQSEKEGTSSNVVDWDRLKEKYSSVVG